MKKTKETEQYSNAKKLYITESAKNISRKECRSKILKVKLVKPQCHMLNKINCKQIKLEKNQKTKNISSN